VKQYLQHHSDTIFAFAMTGFTFAFGGFDKAFIAFCSCLVLDTLTGITKGIKSGEFSSRRMREGFATKVGYLIVIILATVLDRLMPDGAPILRTIALWFYIFVEGSSVIENLAQMGVPIPQAIVDRLAVIKGKSGGVAKLNKDGHFDEDIKK
jgi:toxin secretion/phage lysis holin